MKKHLISQLNLNQHLFKIILSLSFVFFISACGSTSGIKQQDEATENLSLSEYDVVIIKSFKDGTKNSNLPHYASSNFSERISSAIKGKGVFKHVLDEETYNSMGPTAGPALALSGVITRYEEGNAALKFMIGFGAGSTYFDANVELVDVLEGSNLGWIKVDRNSWALGGGVAAGQTVEQFMNEAAQKIANEIEIAKNNSSVLGQLESDLGSPQDEIVESVPSPGLIPSGE